MTVRLFPDQERVLAEAEAELGNGGSPLVQMPTGAGKTEVAVALVERRQFRRVLFLVPGRVLLKQTAERFAAYGIPAVPAWPAGRSWPLAIFVVVVTPTTASNRQAAGLMPDVDLVIVDEAHHCYTASGKTDSVVVDLIRTINAPVVGLTATPWVLNKRGRFDRVFTKLIEGDGYQDLVSASPPRLAPLDLLVPADGRAVQEGELDRTGETTARGIAEANEDETVYTERAVALLSSFQDAVPLCWRPTIFYAISVGHAINVANLLAAAHVRTGLVMSRRPNSDESEIDPRVVSDRDAAVEMFIGGKVRVLVNYAIVKEGFDCGSAEVVVLSRPTASQALYDQMIGRASRVAPGKAAGVVIDLTANHKRHGAPGAARRYSLSPRSEWEGGGGDPPFVECEPWPTPAAFADVGANDVRPWCGWLPSWRTRRCPTCDGIQGDVCRRCGRFRRWRAFQLRNRAQAGEQRNACESCRIEEQLAWEAEHAQLVAADGGGADWLYRRMTRTQRSYSGETSPQSKYTQIDGRGVAGIEVESRRGHVSFRPYLILDGDEIDIKPKLDGRRTTGVRGDAAIALFDVISDLGLVHLVADKRRRRKEPSR